MNREGFEKGTPWHNENKNIHDNFNILRILYYDYYFIYGYGKY